MNSGAQTSSSWADLWQVPAPVSRRGFGSVLRRGGRWKPPGGGPSSPKPAGVLQRETVAPQEKLMASSPGAATDLLGVKGGPGPEVWVPCGTE